MLVRADWKMQRVQSLFQLRGCEVTGVRPAICAILIVRAPNSCRPKNHFLRRTSKIAQIAGLTPGFGFDELLQSSSLILLVIFYSLSSKDNAIAISRNRNRRFGGVFFQTMRQSVLDTNATTAPAVIAETVGDNHR